MRRPKLNHSPQFEAKVALAGLQGEKTLAELAEQFDVHPNQMTQWKTRRLEQTVQVFDGKTPNTEEPVDIKTLHAKSDQLLLENAFLESALIKAGMLCAKR